MNIFKSKIASITFFTVIVTYCFSVLPMQTEKGEVKKKSDSISEKCNKSLKKYEVAFKSKLLFNKTKGNQQEGGKAGSFLVQEELSEYKPLLKKAKEALENGDLEAFDAGTSDNACQVRASKTLDIYKTKKEAVMKNLEEVIRNLDENCLCEDTILQKEKNLTQNLTLSLTEDSKYLILCFLVKNFETTEKKGKDLLAKVSSFKQQLVFCAVNYLQEVAKKNLESCMLEDFKILGRKEILQELQIGLKQVSGDNEKAKISAPNFFGVLTLLQDDLKKGICICLKVKNFCKKCKCAYDKVLFYKPNDAKNELVVVPENAVENILDSEPVMVVTGNVYDGSFEEFAKLFDASSLYKALIAAENYQVTDKKNISCDCRKSLDDFEKKNFLGDIFFPNEAQHMQFPVESKSGQKIEIDFMKLPKLKAYYEENVKKSKENGTSTGNMSLFLIDHIYASTFKFVKEWGMKGGKF